MRGAPDEDADERTERGIIPAYAGSTLHHERRGLYARDHPRVCGEHTFAELDAIRAEGSSPRMRGALSGVRAAAPPARDHPRVCGEHSGSSRDSSKCAGSSPRMRGAPSMPLALSLGSRDHPRVCGEHTS